MKQLLPALLFATALVATNINPAAIAQSSEPTLDELMPKAPQSPARPGANFRSMSGTIRLFDSVLIYPLPDWTTPDRETNPLADTNYSRGQQRAIFHLEMVPKGENKKDWKNLYAILAQENYPHGIRGHVREIIGGFRAGCRPSNTTVRPGRGTDTKFLLIIACGSYANNPSQGELAAFVVMQRGSTAVRLYREWRAPAFRSEDENQWPINGEELGKILTSMQKARLFPAR